RDMAGSIVMARNQEFSGLSTAVAEGDEVAFLPPVSGGLDQYTHEICDAQGNFYALTRRPIDSHEIAAQLVQGEDGAVIVFEGVNRLKRLVPVWKKEHFADGEVWVEGEWDENAPLAARG